MSHTWFIWSYVAWIKICIDVHGELLPVVPFSHYEASLRSWRDSWAGEQRGAAEPPYSLTASPLALTASLPKQKHSRAKSRQLRRLPWSKIHFTSTTIMILKVIEKLGSKYHLCLLLQYCFGGRTIFIHTSIAPRKKTKWSKLSRGLNYCINCEDLSLS